MDVSESKKPLISTKLPLVSSENKNGTTRRSQTREVSSRYRSPSPVSKRSPSPNITSRTTTSTTVPVPKRAISAERKRPSTPPSTHVHDTSASRKTVTTDKSPESSLWPSTMRSLNVSHNRPSSNVARKSDTPERKGSPLKGKNLSAADVAENSRVVDRSSSNAARKSETPERNRSPLKGKNLSADVSDNSRVVDSLHRWPSRTGGKVLTNKTDIITDKITKTPSLFPSTTVTRRLSLDGTISKPSQKSANDLLKLIPRDESRKEILHGSNSVIDDDDAFDRISVVNARRQSLPNTSGGRSPSPSVSRGVSPFKGRSDIINPSHNNSDDNDALFDRISVVNARRQSLPNTSGGRDPSPLVSRGVSPFRGRSVITNPSYNNSDDDGALFDRIPVVNARRQSLPNTSGGRSPSPSVSRGVSPFRGRSVIIKPSYNNSDDNDALFDRTSVVNARHQSLPNSSGGRSPSPSISSGVSPFRGRSVIISNSDDGGALFDRISVVNARRQSLPDTSGGRSPSPSVSSGVSPFRGRSVIINPSHNNSDDDGGALFDRISVVNDRRQSLPNTSGGRSPSSSVSRGVGPFIGRSVIINPSYKGNSPARIRPSSPSRQPQHLTPVLSFVADVKKVKKVENNNVDDVHRLRLLYNRHLQWRYANAQTIAALNSQTAKAEKIFYSVWRIILDRLDAVREKKSDLQQLRLKLRLYSLLDNQLTYLNEWTSIERDYIISLNCTIQDLQATTIRIPVSDGATVDIRTVKAAMCSAVDVMMLMGSSLCSILPQVEETNSLVSKLADVAARERAMLDECESLLRSTAAYQVEEDSLRTQLIQMNQALDK